MILLTSTVGGHHKSKQTALQSRLQGHLEENLEETFSLELPRLPYIGLGWEMKGKAIDLKD